jgi:dynein heavy chain
VLLGLQQTDFLLLQKTKDTLEPYEELWSTVANFNKEQARWMRGPISNLNALMVDNDVKNMFATSVRLLNTLSATAPEPASVAEQIKNDLTKFKPNIPLLYVLTNKGMKDRHWQQISDLVGFDLRPDKHTSLTRVLDMGTNKHILALTAISEGATKEWAVEKAMEQMKQEWVPVQFAVKKHKDTSTYLLTGDSIEDIQSIVDDHILKVPNEQTHNCMNAHILADANHAWFAVCQAISG